AAGGSRSRYVADYWNNTSRRLSSGGVVTTLAGLAGSSGTANGVGSTARFANPFGVTVDLSGNIYVADFENSAIRKIAVDGTVSTFAGVAGIFGSADGIGSAARFKTPLGIVVDASA